MAGVNMTAMKQRDADEDQKIGFCELTPTQMKVLEGVNSGRLNKQIAFDLGISQITVKLHRSNVMRKMQANSVGELIRAWEAIPEDLRERRP